jgi:hypothetical protein
VRVSLPQAATLAALLLLAVLGVSTFRESWHGLDVQRATYSGLTQANARDSCVAATGVDPNFLSWVGKRIPPRSRYSLQLSNRLYRSTGSFCIRLLLLPRLATKQIAGTRYVIFWENVPPPVLADARRRGATIETFRPGFLLARLP